MTSWDGTSSVTVRRSIFCMRSMNGTSRMRPGPRGPTSRPRRKTTPRSYSLTILIVAARTTRMISRIGMITNSDDGIRSSPMRTSSSSTRRRGRSQQISRRVGEREPYFRTRRRTRISDYSDSGGIGFGRGGATHKQSQAVHAGDGHRHALRNRRHGLGTVARGSRLPELAGDKYNAIGVERSAHGAHGAYQALAAGGWLAAPNCQREAADDEEDADQASRGRPDQRPIDEDALCFIEQHVRPRHEQRQP